MTRSPSGNSQAAAAPARLPGSPARSVLPLDAAAPACESIRCMMHLARESLRSSDMAIDLGTAATRVAAGAQLIRERRSASGERRALAGGVVIDPEAAVEVLRPILWHARRWMGFSRVRALACAPTDATAEERGALSDCIARAGAAAVFISPEPLAAAIGAGVDVGSQYAKLIIDIGEGVTDCAVIRSAQIVTSLAVRTGCADLRAGIREHIFKTHRAGIGDDAAERLLRAAGVGGNGCHELAISCSRAGEPRSLVLQTAKLKAAIAPRVEKILECVRALLRDLPPRLAVEVIEDGIFLTGGGALLKGMAQQIARVAQVDVHVAAEPLRSVVCGARSMLPAVGTLRLWKD